MIIKTYNSGSRDGYIWKPSDSQVFWGEIAPNNHLLQLYDDQEVLLDTLEGFIINGIREGESVIVIAKEENISRLEKRLLNCGMDVVGLQASGQYIILNAEETLARFMVNDMPDEERFMTVVSDLLKRARNNKRKVRAFGEMVAILWEKGNRNATEKLELLWNKFCKKHAFCLFCAYPKSCFTGDGEKSIMDICGAHSKVISGSKMPENQIIYNTHGYLHTPDPTV